MPFCKCCGDALNFYVAVKGSPQSFEEALRKHLANYHNCKGCAWYGTPQCRYPLTAKAIVEVTS